MFPVHTKVMCSLGSAGRLDSDTQRPPQFGNRRDMRRTAGRLRRGVGEVGPAVAPADHHRVDAVSGRALDVVAAVADHEHPLGQRLQLRQGVRQHVGLGGPGAVDAGSGDDLEVLVETEMGQDASCRRLCLRRGHREPDARGPQVGQ